MLQEVLCVELSSVYFVLQEVLVWLDGCVNALGDNWTEQDLKNYVWNTLKSGVVNS